jgi:subtilase family serine protease
VVNLDSHQLALDKAEAMGYHYSSSRNVVDFGLSRALAYTSATCCNPKQHLFVVIRWPSLPCEDSRLYSPNREHNKDGPMKKLSVLSVGVLALLVAALPLMAQAPTAPKGFAHTNVVVFDAQNPSTPTGILPVEYSAAYGFNQIRNAGAGVTIALVDAFEDPNIVSDLAFYASYFHKAPCNFTVVNLASVEGQGWDLEESLDVQQACALAPLANIVLVEAASSSFTDLLTAVQMATQAPYNATVVSMSWGGSEFSGEQDYDSDFCNITNSLGQPVTFVAATGDGGHGTIYPSTSPCVIAAGGTTLALATSTVLPNPLQINYGMESAWNGSGGGVSTQESQMSWQNPACATWSSTKRCVPDIASDANPGTGVPVYDTFSYHGWVQVGGTSVATPDWGSFFTLVNSARVANGGTTLSQAAQDLYTLYYNPTTYATDFHDITTGTNGNCGSQCTAAVGYDLVTGIGSYQANNLYPAMVADPN